MSRGAQRGASYPAACASLFGSFQLRRANGSEIAIANRRARVILAMLCAQSGRPINRDILSKLLWPGRFEAHAKASLRQCLLDLGKLLAPLGAEILDVTRSTVALHPGLIDTDFTELEEALAQGDDVRATELLNAIGTQPILDHIDFGDGLNRWLAQCRNDTEKRLSIAVEQRLAALIEAGTNDTHTRLLAAWSARSPAAGQITAPSKFEGKTRIAVLPFQSLNILDGHDYFADGMVDELITTLGQVRQLMVAGHTSSFHFRGSDLPTESIAEALRVSHLIEGSVQRQGDRVRIHVHLIAGETGFELWAQRFDGSLDDIFALQEQVAQAVTAAISGALGVEMERPLVAGMTSNKAAYDLYLQGRTLSTRVFGDGALDTAVDFLEQAIALDPDFAEAWTALAEVHQLIAHYTRCMDRPAEAAKMAECARRAIALAPGRGHAYALLGIYQWTQNDIVGALDLAHKAHVLEPDNPTVTMRLGQFLLYCGRTNDAAPYVKATVDQDPVDARKYGLLSTLHMNLNEHDEAQAAGQRVVDLGFPSIYLGVASLVAGAHELAVEQYRQTRHMMNTVMLSPAGTMPMSDEAMDAFWTIAANGICSGREPDRDQYCKVLDIMHTTLHDPADVSIVIPAVFMGYAEMVFKTLGSRITVSNMVGFMSLWSEGANISKTRQHPEFIPFAQRIGMAAAWDKYGWPDLLPPPSNLRGAAG